MRHFFKIIALAILFCGCNQRRQEKSANVIVDDSIKIYESQIRDSAVGTNIKYLANQKLYNFVKNDNTLRNREKLLAVANNFYKLNDSKKYKEVVEVLVENSTSALDTLNTARGFKSLGAYYLESAKNDSAFYYYLKAEELVLQMPNKSLLGTIYLDMAFIKLYGSDFTGSEISASKALQHLSKEENKFNIYDAYNIIGVCSNELKNYPRALEYHNKALKFYTDNELVSKFHLDASSLNNIGYVYQNMNRDRDAIIHFKKALSDNSLYKDNAGLYAMLLDNLAYSYFKLRDFRELPDLYEKSLAIRDSLETDPSGMILNKIHLSQLYSHLNDDYKARKIAREALIFSKDRGVASDVLSSLHQMMIVDKENAGEYAQQYIKISDSIQQIERTAKDKFARIQYETYEISQEKDKLAEQNRNLLYIFIGTITIGILLFVIRTQRAKNRELLLMQAQQKANEDIYSLMINQQNTIEESRTREKKRIAQELHDGVLGRLFGARLNLDSLNRINTENAILKRNDYLTELKNIEQDIREISHDLNREKYVLINNFLAILNNLVEEQKNSFSPNVYIEIDDEIKWDHIENISKINLYRIIQESLQNINKYANASIIRIQIRKNGDSVSLAVIDDGVGFQVNARKKGIGLQNMIERTQEINGVIDIRSKKGKGTTISISIPINTI